MHTQDSLLGLQQREQARGMAVIDMFKEVSVLLRFSFLLNAVEMRAKPWTLCKLHTGSGKLSSWRRDSRITHG